MLRQLSSILITTFLASDAAFAQFPEPPSRGASPDKVVRFLMEEPYMWNCGNAAMQRHRELEPVYNRIASHPAAFQDAIAKAERLPATIDELIQSVREQNKRLPPEPMERVPARAGVVARLTRVISLSEHLGRECAGPILKEIFESAVSLHKDLQPRYKRAVDDWKARGGQNGVPSPEDRDELLLLNSISRSLIYVATRAVHMATQLNSPMLIDPVLEFYEAGRDHGETGWPEYVVKCGGHREDVPRRLQNVLDSGKVSHLQGHLIFQALRQLDKSRI
ncbi:MAG: hypothetical protein KF678_04745 [Phycisphaeraceae bacterium]|nr:hypothetical protein [Phycisphaeraceae bacterium]